MFTTIKSLRTSHAQQNRVSLVENWLKKQNAGYTPESLFPIFVIAASNTTDDMDWVIAHANTHVKWPAMEKEVLAAFGHSNVADHLDFLETKMRERAGKAKGVAEVAEKYNPIFQRIGGNVFWPFKVVPNVVNATETPAAVPATIPAKPAAKPAAKKAAAKPAAKKAEPTVPAAAKGAAKKPAAVKPAAKPTAKEFAAQSTQKKELATKPQVETTADNSAVVGAFYIAIGKIIALKNKSFLEACKWAGSPTGGRTYAEYAMQNGVDGAEARSFLKAFNGRAAGIEASHGASVATYLAK